jgi:hypothetical protein
MYNDYYTRYVFAFQGPTTGLLRVRGLPAELPAVLRRQQPTHLPASSAADRRAGQTGFAGIGRVVRGVQRLPIREGRILLRARHQSR